MVQISEILKLNTEKRIELVELIWDSVEKDSIDALPNEMKLLLDERLEDLRLNPTRYVNVSLFGKKNKPYTAPVNDTLKKN